MVKKNWIARNFCYNFTKFISQNCEENKFELWDKKSVTFFSLFHAWKSLELLDFANTFSHLPPQRISLKQIINVDIHYLFAEINLIYALKLSLVFVSLYFCFTLNAFLNLMKLVLHWINVWICWLSQIYMFAVDYFQAFHSIFICTEVSIKSCAWLLLHVYLFRNWTDLCTTATVRTRRPCLSTSNQVVFINYHLLNKTE